jgi:hypothetical protein
MKRSIYGLNYAPHLWWEHILKALKELGLKPNKHDQCLFYMKDLMIVLYVDDAGIAAPTVELIDVFVDGLKAKGFELTKKGSFSEFLGIKFEEDTSAGSITMTQTGLIKKIIATTKIENCNPNWVPAAKEALRIDPEGKPMEEDWSYPSIVGMLLYLLTNTRPDIAFAVSQVTCFKHNSKKLHATAIKMIIRYLACTSNKGTIAKPTGSLLIDCYIDPDFASLYSKDPDASRSSAKSRLGYVITLGRVLLIWKSQLIQEICLSTTFAKYNSLSQALPVVLPICSLILELAEPLCVPQEIRATIHARVFEDNNGAYLLATTHPLTGHTRYFHVKYHHFWDAHNQGLFEILPIPTKYQRGDYMTKGMVHVPFKHNHFLVQLW